MKGVVIQKANIIAEDNRRRIISILNGQLTIRDIHLLEMKKGEVNEQGFIKLPLGNHKHWYAEVCYCYKGKAHYWLRNKEGEELECDLNEGEIMFRAPEVVHTCLCTEDCILIDGAQESWINDDWNHIQEILKGG